MTYRDPDEVETLKKQVSDLKAREIELLANISDIQRENQRLIGSLAAEKYASSKEEFADALEAQAWAGFAQAYTSNPNNHSVDGSSSFADKMMVEFRKRKKTHL